MIVNIFKCLELINQSFNSQINTMITKDGDYYICEGDATQDNAEPPQQKQEDTILEAQGDIQYRLTLIK